MSETIKILWADDEIDLLKPHVMFLENKGYLVDTANNGLTALEKMADSDYDLVFLDENMPGLSGLETLTRIKEEKPYIPVIMITKSEEESIMEEAIGSKISDYLIKPVNPKQILLSVKKNLDTKRLVNEKTTSGYQQEFRTLGMRVGDRMDWDEWKEVYKKLVFWELELDKTEDDGMKEILRTQKDEANQNFNKYVKENYIDWMAGEADFDLSHSLLKSKAFPKIKESNRPYFVIVIDNLRYDQWQVLRPAVREHFNVDEEDLYLSILPTATQYARNALFAGLTPLDISKKHPQYWKNDDEEGGKNLFEKELFQTNLDRSNMSQKMSYNKVTSLNFGKKLIDNFSNLLDNDVNVIVYNFVDMLSHARTDMDVIKELAQDEAAYRSLTNSWFEHSPLKEIIQKIADAGCDLFITTDHGMINVDEPSKVVGDRNTNTNLRYKQGRNLQYNQKEVFEVKRPEDVCLPKINMSSTYIFAGEGTFFAYPNNYNHYVKHYRNTFQHGGISLEEMIIPYVSLRSKRTR